MNFQLQIFLPAVSFLTMVAIAVGGVVFLVRHTWLPVRIVGAVVAIIAAAAAITIIAGN